VGAANSCASSTPHAFPKRNVRDGMEEHLQIVADPSSKLGRRASAAGVSVGDDGQRRGTQKDLIQCIVFPTAWSDPQIPYRLDVEKRREATRQLLSKIQTACRAGLIYTRSTNPTWDSTCYISEYPLALG
jgi:hypothetical protein